MNGIGFQTAMNEQDYLAEVAALRSKCWPADAPTVPWCKQSMSVYKIPELRVVDSLPMTATGKIIKTELEEML